MKTTMEWIKPGGRGWSRALRGAALVAGAWALSAMASAAQARDDVYWSIGVHSPGITVGVSNVAPVRYYHPAPVVVTPPVVYAPPPVVVYPGVRYVRAHPPVVRALPPGHRPKHWRGAPPPHHRHDDKHHHHHHRR
jgi:hypothetical protein